MNIFVIILYLMEYYPEPDARAIRRAATQRHCIRRRNTARVAIKTNVDKIVHPYVPSFDVEGEVSYYKRITKPCKNKVSNKWDTFYFKKRCIIDNGRVHAGDKKRKGKRPYKKEPLDKIRFKQEMKYYEEEMM